MSDRETKRCLRPGVGQAAAAILLTIAASPGRAGTPADVVLEIPLTMVAGRPQVEVLVNGEGPYPFVLDTGSSLNVLDTGIARQLGLEVTGQREIGAPGMEQVPADIVNASTLEVHGFELSNEELVTMDLAEMSGGIFLGVLRFGAFENSLATLDLAAAVLRLSPSSLDPSAPGVIAFSTAEELIDIPISIGDQHTTAHIDSGSPGGITIPAKLAATLDFSEGPVAVGEARLVGGRGTASRGKLDGVVAIGPLRIEDPEVNILDLPIPKVNLGSQFLAEHLVRIDQQHGLIHFEPTPAAQVAAEQVPAVPGASPPAGRRLGLKPVPGPPGPNGLALLDGGLPIEWVEPGSLASDAGLREGDLVLSVNGKSLTDFDAATLIALFRGSAPLRMELRRAGSSKLEVVAIP